MRRGPRIPELPSSPEKRALFAKRFGSPETSSALPPQRVMAA
jgi:hypothetical protein